MFWFVQFCSGDSSPSVILDDPQGLFGGNDNSGASFTGEGKVAYLYVLKTEVCFADPDDDEWNDMDESRVYLDDENVRIRIRVYPKVPSFSCISAAYGGNVVVSTSGTNPQGVAIAVSDGDLVQSEFNCTEIRLSRTFSQLKAGGLLPSVDDDGINEMACVDMGSDDPLSDSDLSDSQAFLELGYGFRGYANKGNARGLSLPLPVSVPSESFFRAAGVEVVSALYAGVEAEKRQVMNQSDVFYCSGHGLHMSGEMEGFDPGDISDYWKKDLDCVIFAGCSILDINDYNNHYLDYEGVWDPDNHKASPGKLWELTGPNVLLGYNYVAPLDSSGAPERIVRAWKNSRQALGDIDAWMNANDNKYGRNACAIAKGDKYVYFKRTRHKFFSLRFSTYEKVEVRKENWND